MGPRAGSLGAFLLSLPVSAILLMAVFGVPRFAPGDGNAESGGWQDAREFLSEMTGQSRAKGDSDSDHPLAGGDHPFGDDDRDRSSDEDAEPWPGSGTRDRSSPFAANTPRDSDEESSETRDWPFPGRRGASERVTEGGGTRSDRTADDRGGVSRDRVENNDSLTWREARLWLADRGINDFHLEPGTTGETFVFACVLSLPDDPRVLHRFEAEDAEPLTAVGQVLGQVDLWLQTRYAAQ
jgi:hypothetical protein